MDGLERRYKVRKRNKYEENLNSANKDIALSGGLLVMTGSLVALGLSLGAFPVSLFAGVSAPTAFNLMNLVKAIYKRANLRTNIEEINSSMMQAEDYQNGSVGRRR